MRVIISGEVVLAIAKTMDAVKLHQLLIYAVQGRHVLSFDPPTALDAWLSTIDRGTQDAYARAIELAARAAATLSANSATVRVELTDRPFWEDPVAVLPVDEALGVLGEPLGILLENFENDWFFLCGIMRLSEREQIQRAVEKGWAERIHGGGSELRKQLDTRLQIPHKGLRTFVVFDSDRLHPDELINGWSPCRSECQAFEWEKLTAEKLPFRYWMLRRRFIESYMPEVELTKGASRDTPVEAARAFYRMSQEARWYFNMKKGFDGDSKRHDAKRCRDLYSKVDPTDYAALQKGFGEKLANHYVQAVNYEFNWDNEALQEAAQAIPRLMRLL